jgi:DNA topoisomerase-3
LPEGHLAQAKEVLGAIRMHAPTLAPAADKADLSLRSKAWNDKKVTAHHAIIPTPNVSGAAASLSSTERDLYDLLCRRYLAQFYSPHEYLMAMLELDIAGERFAATGRQLVAPGWKALSADVPDDEPAAKHRDAESNASAPLPRLQAGDRVMALQATVAAKQTQLPKPFNDASLIPAMCAVAKFVTNPNIEKLLAEADGIGTPATRAAIIETLFERGYVAREKKTIVSTRTGRSLTQSLPEVATTPDMTALWEAATRAITDGQQTLEAFLGRVSAQLEQLVQQGRALGQITVAEGRRCAKPGCTGYLRRLDGPSGPFWSCRDCRSTLEDPGATANPRDKKPSRSKADRVGHGKKKTDANGTSS